MDSRSADPAAQPRNEGVDVLRGAAIVLVVLHHTGLRIPLHETALADILPVRLLKALCFNGYEAVFVFFVVSGFLIAGNAIGRDGALSRLDARGFYVRRFARIAPCLLLLVAVLCVLDAAGFEDHVFTRPGQSLGGAVRSVLLLHANWYEGHTWWLPGDWGVLWSLSIEEAFYLGFPLACLLARASRPGFVLSLAALALSLPATHAALAGNAIWQEKAYLPGMAAIAAGVMAAILADRVRRPPPWVPRVLGAAGLAGLAAVFLAKDLIRPTLADATLLVLTFGTATLLLSLRWRPVRVPGTAWLRSFGRLSYEVYLTHMFAVFPAVQLFRDSGGDLAAGFLWFPPVLASAWALGWLTARLVSAPADAWVRRVLLARPEGRLQPA